MSGLNLYSSLRAGAYGGEAPQYGSKKSYESGGGGASAAAFGDGVTPAYKDVVGVDTGTGVAFWIGVGAIAALCWIRHTLPN